MQRFWEHVALAEMTQEQWEALCDGCGKCCLVKLEDEDSGTLAYTDLACTLLDCATARCRDYENRARRVSDCVVLRPDNLDEVYFMPPSCAYRRLAEGKGLPDWHPLIAGTPTACADAGHSVAGRVRSETGFDGDFESQIIIWPDREID